MALHVFDSDGGGVLFHGSVTIHEHGSFVFVSDGIISPLSINDLGLV